VSTLVVEVCEVKAVEPHPRADRLAVATIKGWKVCVRYDPATGQAEFQPGEKCVYFPPDAILPPELAESRLGIMKYLAELPRNEHGRRPPGGRVRATRLRGEQSFGVIMRLDPAFGDDPNWPVGTDVREHYGVGKWEPVPQAADGDAAPEHPHFHRYTQLEHWSNYPDVLREGEEVVLTEKLHGKNCRLGLVLDAAAADEPGGTGEAAGWSWMAGSHDVRRQEFSLRQKRFDAVDLVEKLILTAPAVEVGQVVDFKDGRFWRVDEVRPLPESDGRVLFKATEVTQAGHEIQVRSEYWEPLSGPSGGPVRSLLEYLRDGYPWPEPKFAVVLFGEIIGRGVQKGMEYGLSERSFRAFDVAINGRYLGYEEKSRLFAEFGVEPVPVLYRGPLSQKVITQHTDGPTTLAAADELGSFKGREGVVITPVVEREDAAMLRTGNRGRVIFKSVSADYLAAKNISDSH
jgi:hypothetical protein